ncbi:MAG TPA: hypothetical protein VD929_07005 [Caulobacteraceae bacterium]|nr:hypothetical protein [Caulobacteraceae bacterium]
MRRRDLITAAVLAGAAGPALAAGPKAGKETVGQYVDLSPVALPVIVDGRLKNYVFVTVRLKLTAKADVQKLRAKEPYFRDALVRAGHRTPFVLAADWTRLDEVRLKTALAREAAAIAGAGLVQGVEVVSQQAQRQTGVNPPKA